VTDLELYAEAQRAEARRLEAELPALNERLGIARRRQETMQRPSVLITERLTQRLADLRERVRSRLRRT
jgi:hypothetical protein